MRTLFFYLLSAAILFSAYFVVTARNLFRSAIGLIAILLGIAGMYLLMDAQFLSAVQITVYIGGIVVLIVYVVLLIADVTQKSFHEARSWRKATVGVFCALLFTLLLAALSSHNFESLPAAEHRSTSVAEIGKALLSPDKGGFVLAFELISLLLIAAIVGALTVARATPAESGGQGKDGERGKGRQG